MKKAEKRSKKTKGSIVSNKLQPDNRQKEDSNLEAIMNFLGEAAQKAASFLSSTDNDRKNKALHAAAVALRDRKDAIKEANSRDMTAARDKGLNAAMLDRLVLDDQRIEATAKSIEAIASLPDPVGTILEEWQQPSGLSFQKLAVPLGVIGIIYESRPNVTADAGALCIKSGNAAILRGGSESFYSSGAIMECLQKGLDEAGLPKETVQRVPTTDREAVGMMLSMSRYIDLIIPRGGRGLTERVMNSARVPILAHLDGLCHSYIHAAANPEMAKAIVLNAKLRRTGICGATETLLVDEAFSDADLLSLLTALQDQGCEIRGDSNIQALLPSVAKATEDDWRTEYLDSIIAVKRVEGLEAAIKHINRYGSRHTEAIVTEDQAAAKRFQQAVDASIVMQNASTQFADGGEFGFGAEIGIATGKIHARGPVGARQLTSYKYLVMGRGATRPA